MLITMFVESIIRWVLSRQVKVTPPPLNLDVTLASYLGTPTDPFVPVSVLVVGSADVAIVAGNGPHTFGLTPSYIMGGNSTCNATLVMIDAGQTPPVVRAVWKIGSGSRIDHATAALSRNGGSGGSTYVAVAGDFGVALLVATGTTLTVSWHDALEQAELGACGLCCDGGNKCRTAVGRDGTVGLVLPTQSGNAVTVFSDMGKVGSRTYDHDVTDIAVVDNGAGLTNTVLVTSFYSSSTGREPMVMPGLDAFDYYMKKEVFRAWPWGSGHPCEYLYH